MTSKGRVLGTCTFAICLSLNYCLVSVADESYIQPEYDGTEFSYQEDSSSGEAHIVQVSMSEHFLLEPVPPQPDLQQSDVQQPSSLSRINRNNRCCSTQRNHGSRSIFGCFLSQRVKNDWLHSFEYGMYANENNFVFTGGVQATLRASSNTYSGLRALGTISDLKNLSPHGGYSFDWFHARQNYLTDCPYDFIKYSIFHDRQHALSQTGVALGALLLSDCRLPLTVDAAFAFDTSSYIPTSSGINVESAEQDYQLRLGTYVTPYFQGGVSTYYAVWDHGLGDSYGVGVFANLQLRRALLQLDITGGKEGVDGFVNLVFKPGAWSRDCCSSRVGCRQCCPSLPCAWMARPVARNLAIRTKLRPNPNNGGGDDLD